MQRICLFILLSAFFVVDSQAQETAAAPAADSAADAKQNFDRALVEWRNSTEKLQSLYKQKADSGDAQGEVKQQIDQVRKQNEALLEQIVSAGLSAYKANPDQFPKVNETLVLLARFFVTGDTRGDGGDQYERALPLIKALLEGGGGEKWEDLWILGGVSAYCLEQYNLAEKYFNEAQKRGLFDNISRQQSQQASTRVQQQAAMWKEELPKIRLRWQKEQALRKQEAADDDLPRVKLVTSQGDIIVELFENEAPESVANFINLVKQGYYNDVTFHRVLPMFMAQGGDPQGTGSGGPGYTIRDEHTKANHRKHFRGSLSMAKTGAPNSGGSQFFLCFVPTSYLDGKHTAFGRVIEGMENAAALKRRDPSIGYLPKPDRIISAEVIRDRGHNYAFERLPELRR